jgi:OmpA family/BON domain
MSAASIVERDWAGLDRWKRAIAICLALLLLILWLMGRGPGSGAGCCGNGVVAVATAVAVKPAANLGYLSAQDTGGKVTLTGQVKDEATKKVLEDAATAVYGADRVMNQLTVNSDAAPLSWLAQAGDLFKGLKGKGDVGLKLAGSGVLLTGAVADVASKTALGDWASKYFGTVVVIDNQLQTPALPPPPAVKVYFASGKADVQAQYAAELGVVSQYLKANAGKTAVLSGFHDPRGSVALNEALALQRSQAVRAALQAQGVAESLTVIDKPANSLGSGAPAEARRVEVIVK